MADTKGPTGPPSEFLAACPKFRILVLGNPESTKQELFSKIFGVDLPKKLVDAAFSGSQGIETELDLQGQNERLAIHTSPNFWADDERVYDRVHGFLVSRSTPSTKQEDRIHCIWYCVASEEQRPVGEVEKRFFNGLGSFAPHVPLVLVFTKYDEFVSKVKLDWSRDAQEQGLSKVAVSHILRDLSSKKFEKQIGKKWDDVLNETIQRVCVSSGDSEDDTRSFEELAGVTLAGLQHSSVKFAFAAAQRNSAAISTQFCADTAASYFEVDTGHARKMHGVDMRDILPNFFSKAVQLFNMRDPAAVLADAALLPRVLDETFDSSQKPLLAECLGRSGTESGTILLNLSPHERAVLLAQALAGVVLFLHRLAGAQWPHQDAPGAPSELTQRAMARELETVRLGREKREVLETVEASTVFTTCSLRKEIADLIVRAIRNADKFEAAHHHGASRAIVVEDDSELQEISLSFVNDKGPDDMVLPCGLTILPLN
ncbi:hypothetical protein MFIFM68171_11115 [Madurella fahalii]|uniref:G domain-containing protein n=1 Tax=Madurella fahalii TaxID=1157608 RepID=A0ABQ0GT42_9PEZI